MDDNLNQNPDGFCLEDAAERNGNLSGSGYVLRKTPDVVVRAMLRRLAVEDLEGLTKLVAVMAGVLYLLGIFGVNSYLLSLGASDFSLFRVRYIFTGFWAVVYMIVIIQVTIMMRDVYYSWKDGCENSPGLFTPFRKATRVRYCIRGAAANTSDQAFHVLYLLSACGGILILVKPNGFDSFFILGKMALFCAAFAYLWIVYYDKKFRGYSIDWSAKHVVSAIFVSIASIISSMVWVVIFFVRLFGVEIFPSIPVQLGGARPAQSVMLYDDALTPMIRGVSAGEEGGKSHNMIDINLLWEGSDFYIVRVANNTIVRIDRRYVLAVAPGQLTTTLNSATPEANE